MYTYAFLLTPNDPLEMPQGMANPVELVQAGELSALVEPELDLTDIENNDTRLMQAVLWHDQVVQEVFRQTGVLPLRFGTRFLSKAALLEHLRTECDNYVARLHRLSGQAEFVLKASPVERAEPMIAPEVKGKAYFQARKERFQQQADYVEQQRQQLEGLKQAIAEFCPTCRLGDAVEGVERLYVLCDRNSEADLRQQLVQWQDEFPLWSLYLSEALPPYHFV